MSQDYAHALGARLRSIRAQQGLSLHGVEEKSEGRWKAVVVGSYERGDRAVTVAKLAELAEFYGVPVAELLPDARATRRGLAEPEARHRPAAAGRTARPPGRPAGPIRRGHPVPARRLQRQGADHPIRGSAVTGGDLRHDARRTSPIS